MGRGPGTPVPVGGGDNRSLVAGTFLPLLIVPALLFLLLRRRHPVDASAQSVAVMTKRWHDGPGSRGPRGR